MKHKFSCSSCGKKEAILIDEKTGKIKNKWAFFGKFNINEVYASKYLYELEDCDKPRKVKKILNPQYDPKIKPRYFEYWECPECYEGKDNKK